MTTIKVIFRASNNTEEGTLFFRIIHKRKMRQVHTGCKIRKAEWNADAATVLVSGDDSRVAYLKSVQNKLNAGIARLSRIVSNFDKSGNDYSVGDVVEKYLSPDSVSGFISFARKHIADLKQMGKVRKAEHYATSLNSLERFNGEEEIPFEEFNGSLIQRHEQYLIGEELIPNGISYYMRNLRAIYNQAAEQSYAETTNPFKHVYTVIAKTVKRAIPLSVVKAMKSLDLSHDSLSALARDLFMFSFYTRGMAIIDVAFLRKSGIKGGTLIYRRPILS